MELKEFSKQLNENNDFVSLLKSTAMGTNPGLLSKSVRAQIDKSIDESDISKDAKIKIKSLLDQKKIPEALTVAIKALQGQKY